MKLEISWKLNPNRYLTDLGLDFVLFVQEMANRLLVGHYRYYKKDRVNKKFLTMAKLELETYNKTRNKEHLRNVANYCFLEFLHPEIDEVHDNKLVNSVRRTQWKET